MRVLFVSAYNPFESGNGPSTGLYYLSQALVAIGCDVHILTLKKEVSGKIDDRVSIHFFDDPLGTRFGRWITFSIFSVRQIKELCKSYGIDVIHGRSPSTFGYALICKNEKLPFVVSLHGTSFGEINSCSKTPLKWVDRSTVIDAAISQPLWAFLTSLEYKYADKIIAVSKAVAEEAISYYRLPREKVAVIHNGVKIFHAKEQEEENSVLSVGRMTWRKGFRYLIEAMPRILKEYPKTKLLLVGDGPYRRSLEEYVRKLQLEKSVFFYGNLPRKKLLLLYAKAHAYVQPSLYEPLGNTVLEAMVSEKPVVATEVGGIPEIITNEKDGLIIAPQNSLQIAEAIKTLFSDSSYAKKLGKNAKAKVAQYFSWELAAKKTLKLYEDILRGEGSNNKLN